MSSQLDLSNEFDGRRALVTGGASGIGAAIAHRLLDGGAKVVVAGRTHRDTAPAGATFIAGDLTTKDGVNTVAKQALAELGGLDVLVNNAGGSTVYGAGSWTIPDEDWVYHLELNLLAAVRLTNAVLPALRESKTASVINISSTASTMPFGPCVHYGAAKVGLEYYSRTLALELGPEGIRVNVLTPGNIATDMSTELRKKYPGISTEEWNNMSPLGRVGNTDDVAEVAALLASDRGKFLTASKYLVDGGAAAR